VWCLGGGVRAGLRCDVEFGERCGGGKGGGEMCCGASLGRLGEGGSVGRV
jgi:hypothetical protein